MRMIIAHMDHYDAHHQVIDRCYDHQNSMRIVTTMRIESSRIVTTMRNDLRNNTPEPVLS